MNLIKTLPIIALALGLVIGCGSDKKGASTPPPKSCTGDECPSGQPDEPGDFDSSKASYWDGSLRIQNKGVYRAFLKDFFRLCDLDPFEDNPWAWGIWWDPFNQCDVWDNQGTVVVHFAGGELPMEATIKFTAFNDNFHQAKVLTPIRGEFHPINNNQAIEMRRAGFAGTQSYNDIFKVQSEMGNFQQGRLLLRFYYQGTAFAYTELIRSGQ